MYYNYIISDVVLEDRPWPQGSSRTHICVLGLGLGLDLEGPGLGLVLGLGHHCLSQI